MARGRPKKKVVKEKVSTPKQPTVDISKEREAVVKKILADPRLPKYSDYIVGGLDVTRGFSEIEAEYRSDMVKYNIGMTSLMQAKDEA